MRALFLSSVLALAICLPSPAKAAEEAMPFEVQRQIFAETMQGCLKEVYSMKGYGPEYGTSLIEDCIKSKGVNLQAYSSPIGTSVKAPRAYKMGGAPDGQARALTYQIDNVDKFLDNIQGKKKVQPEPAQASAPPPAAAVAPAVAPVEERERRVSPQSGNEDGSSSGKSSPKYYLPSDKSGNGAKPIFLGR